MFTCRKELEEILGLRHPRKVLIEEAVELPRGAERLFRGIYSDPEKLKRSFADLQRETSSLLELLGLRRSKLRDWSNDLPASPIESQEYIEETAVELKVRQERVGLVEAKVLTFLQEHEEVRLFPIEEEILGKWSAERIVLFPKVIDKVAALLKVPTDSLNKVILVHFMVHVLIHTGEDRDKRTWSRHELNGDRMESFVHYYSRQFYKQYQYKELQHIDLNLARCLPVAGRDMSDIEGLSREQMHAALVFWRRKSDLSLNEVLGYLRDFG